MKTVKLMEMTREEIRAAAATGTVVLPVAAVEQHGPHLPVGVDTYITEYIAVEAAALASREDVPVYVAPIQAYGSSHHHRPFAGVLSLSSDTLVRVLKDVGRSLIASGFRRIFILNGHGGNSDIIGLVAQDLAVEHDVTMGAASYWTLAREPLQSLMSEKGIPWVPGHAGGFETALIRALRGELVDEGAVPTQATVAAPRSGPLAKAAVHRHRAIANIDGYTDVPARGDKALGEAALKVLVREVAAVLRAFATSQIETP